MLTFTLILEHLWRTRLSYLLGAEHLMRTREKEVFFLNTFEISLAPPPQERSFLVMFVGTRHTQEQNELQTCRREGQNATKINGIGVDFSENIMSVSGSHELLCVVLRSLLPTLQPWQY